MRTSEVANRPHWVTIVLGILGPLTAMVAVTFTFLGYRLSTQSFRISAEALRTAEQNLRYGQQAYLALRNGRIRMYVTQRPKSLWSLPARLVGIESTFDIVNLGNTPADITDIKLQVSVDES